MNKNFYLVIEDALRSRGDRIVIYTDEGRTYSATEILRGTEQFSALLAATGITKGDPVVVQAEKSVSALMFYLACLRSGVVYVPLNTAYRESELRHFIDDAAPRLVVCPADSVSQFETLTTAPLFWLDDRGAGSLVDAASQPLTEVSTATVSENDVAVIIYTSGTTGRSKGAMVTHRNLASNAEVLIHAWGMGPADTLIHALPIFHIHGLFVANHTALISGATLLWHRRFDVQQVLVDMPRATILMGVPTFYTRLLAAPGLDRELTARMRLFISGSAPLLTETFDAFDLRTGHRILERYGMSEAGMIASNPLVGERRAGTVGLPLPGNGIRIADDQDSPLPQGAVGGIQITGPNVFLGYWNLPEKTREEFTADGWFRTGDVGSFGDNGYLSIVGRAKDLIISGGYNVYPKEVELVLDTLPGVAESAVIGVAHPDFGEAVTAVVVAKSGVDLSEQDLIGHLKTSLANYKVPKRIHIVAELPRNAMGKVQKNVLRTRYSLS